MGATCMSICIRSNTKNRLSINPGIINSHQENTFVIAKHRKASQIPGMRKDKAQSLSKLRMKVNNQM